MATKRKTKAAASQPAEKTETGQPVEDKGYSGTVDYTSGKLTSSDPGQATDQQIKDQRASQRGSGQ